MERNYIFSDINAALPALMSELSTANHVESRAGATKEMRHVGITLNNPGLREIRLPSRKANLAAQIAETVWVLSGRNDLEFLSRYLPRAADFSDDGKTWRAGYGPRLRSWRGTDQLREVVSILRANPSSRQAVMSIWDPAVDYETSKDIPCNNWLSFSARDGRLDLHVAIRSNDAMWGWSGINAFEWSVLLEVVASLCNLLVGSIHFSVTSFHLYEQHWEKAEVIAGDRPVRADKPGPQFNPNGLVLDGLLTAWFQAEMLIRYGDSFADPIVENFPEPMLQSWLRVLQWWWTGDFEKLAPLEGTSLYAAASVSVQPKRDPVAGLDYPTGLEAPDFVSYVCNLHLDKDAVYGNSWRRRGEMLGIMANIARKIDRLGTNGAGDTAADTAIDLLVYLAKYLVWIAEGPELSDDPTRANAVIRGYRCLAPDLEVSTETLERDLTEDFEELEDLINGGGSYQTRGNHLKEMLPVAFRLARRLWLDEQR